MSNYLFHHIHCKFYIFHYVIFIFRRNLLQFFRNSLNSFTSFWCCWRTYFNLLKIKIYKERNLFDKVVANLERSDKDIINNASDVNLTTPFLMATFTIKLPYCLFSCPSNLLFWVLNILFCWCYWITLKTVI